MMRQTIADAVNDFDQLTPDELKERMSHIRRARRALPAKSNPGRLIYCNPVVYSPPIVDLDPHLLRELSKLIYLLWLWREGTTPLIDTGSGDSPPLEPPTASARPFLPDGLAALVPKGLVKNLIRYMWDRDAANFRQMVGPVFESLPVWQTLRSLCNKTNNALRMMRATWTLHVDKKSEEVFKKFQNP